LLDTVMIGTTDLEMFANMLESLRSFIGTTAERNTPVSSITCREHRLSRIIGEFPGNCPADSGYRWWYHVDLR
jgi:hypothetical protein